MMCLFYVDYFVNGIEESSTTVMSKGKPNQPDGFYLAGISERSEKRNRDILKQISLWEDIFKYNC